MLNSLNLLNKMLWQENKTDPNFHEHDSNFKLEKLCVIKNSPNKCGTDVEIAANVYWKSIQSQISMYFSGRRINVRWHLKKDSRSLYEIYWRADHEWHVSVRSNQKL